METRTLEDEVERLVSLALPVLVNEARSEGRERLYRAVIARVERPLLRHVLALSGGNQLKAARLLGINRNTLRKRLRLLGLLAGPQDPAGGAAEQTAPDEPPA